ncbi:MAG: hypothetical protein ACREOH_12670 [Candidatus Entotheonellia bacterium]
MDDDEVLRKSGYYIVSDALQPLHTVTIIRIWNGKVSSTDGPFAETKERILHHNPKALYSL